jgi:ferredoxin
VKIVVDVSKCQNYGQCCYEAADVFQLGDGKLVHATEVGESRRSAVESAADVCPMQAITIE